MDLLSGVRTRKVSTDRLGAFLYESGPEDGIPVVMIHGNLSTGRFYEHLWPGAPERYRFIAPDMRSFGRSESKPMDATRGVRDWADDTFALVEALGIQRPLHLVGWSTGGAAIAAYAMDRAAASLTLIAPVSPFGFGGTHRDGAPCYSDWAGSGGGTGNPVFTARLAERDRSSDDMMSPRNIMNSSYWAPNHREPSDREDLLVDEVLLSVTGDDGYPGDFTASENWPGVAPGPVGFSTPFPVNTVIGRTSSNWSESHPCCGPMAVPTSWWPMDQHGRWGPWGRRGWRPAGRGPRCFLPSRWCPRSARFLSSTRRQEAGWRWRCSTARAMPRISMPPNVGRSCSSNSWRRWSKTSVAMGAGHLGRDDSPPDSEVAAGRHRWLTVLLLLQSEAPRNRLSST